MSSLGDLFHALPTVHSLKKGLNAEIDWVVNSQYAATVACFDDVDRVIEFPRQNPFANQKAFLKKLRERHYDLAIDLQGLLKSAYVVRLAKAKRKIGPSFCREFAHIFYSEISGKKDKNRHAVEECLDVVHYLALAPDKSPPAIDFPEYPGEVSHPAIAFAPVSRWRTKNWPPQQFIETGRSLQSSCEAAIFLLGTTADKEICAEIADGIGGDVFNLAGETSIPQLGGLLQEMDLLISVDSGPVHIAAAIHIPVLGLYGITDPRRTGPYGAIHRVIRAPLKSGRHSDFRETTSQNLAVMRSITSPEVVKNAQEMLS